MMSLGEMLRLEILLLLLHLRDPSYCSISTNKINWVKLLQETLSQKLDRILSEHLRAVHRICFHPSEPLLLSASQDGSLKLWDLRAGGSSKISFDGKSESARDCQFNPVSSHEFAAVFDNGSLQLWDIRSPTQFERKWFVFL